MEYVAIGVIFILVLAVVILWDKNVDLRWRLGMSEREAERWKKEAVDRGWKNPFQQVSESLEASVEKLRAAAAAMKQTAETNRQNTERLNAINANLKRANAAMAASNERLDRARALFAPKPARDPVPTAVRPDTQPEQRPEDRMVQEVIRRFEADLAAGKVETDPSKKN